jgi:hypothetical protein
MGDVLLIRKDGLKIVLEITNNTRDLQEQKITAWQEAILQNRDLVVVFVVLDRNEMLEYYKKLGRVHVATTIANATKKYYSTKNNILLATYDQFTKTLIASTKDLTGTGETVDLKDFNNYRIDNPTYMDEAECLYSALYDERPLTYKSPIMKELCEEFGLDSEIIFNHCNRWHGIEKLKTKMNSHERLGGMTPARKYKEII